MRPSPFSPLNPNLNANIERIPAKMPETFTSKFTCNNSWHNDKFDMSASPEEELDIHHHHEEYSLPCRLTPEPPSSTFICRTDSGSSGVDDESLFSRPRKHVNADFVVLPKLAPDENKDPNCDQTPRSAGGLEDFVTSSSLSDVSIGPSPFGVGAESSELSSNSVSSPPHMKEDVPPQIPTPNFSPSLSSMALYSDLMWNPSWCSAISTNHWNSPNLNHHISNLPISCLTNVPLPTLNTSPSSTNRNESASQLPCANEDLKIFQPKLEPDFHGYLQGIGSVNMFPTSLVGIPSQDSPFHNVLTPKIGKLPPMKSKQNDFDRQEVDCEDFSEPSHSQHGYKRRFEDMEGNGHPAKRLKMEPYPTYESTVVNVGGVRGNELLPLTQLPHYSLENLETFPKLMIEPTKSKSAPSTRKRRKSTKSKSVRKPKVKSPRKKRSKRKYPPRSAPREHLNFKGYYAPQTRVDDGVPDLSGKMGINGRHARGFQRGGKRCRVTDGITVINFHDKPPSDHPAYSKIRVWQNEKGSKFYDCRCNARKPVQDLQKIKRHVIGHYQSNFQCDVCGKVFENNHLQLNAHKKFHKKQMKASASEVYSE